MTRETWLVDTTVQHTHWEIDGPADEARALSEIAQWWTSQGYTPAAGDAAQWAKQRGWNARRVRPA